MTTNRKTTTALIVLAAVAATLLAAGTVAVASNHSAFAWKKDKYQRDDERGSGSSVNLIAANEQSSEWQTAGGTSPITTSCNNAATATVTNSGGIVGK
jgi:hypothetical protein